MSILGTDVPIYCVPNLIYQRGQDHYDYPMKVKTYSKSSIAI